MFRSHYRLEWRMGNRPLTGGSAASRITAYAFDFSALPNGLLPSPITGATWAIVSGRAYNTPTAESNLLIDPGLENWASATNLTSWEETQSTSTVNRDNTNQRSGTYCARLDVDAGLADVSIQQNIASQPASRFARLSAWHKGTGSAQVRFSMAVGAVGLRILTLTGTYVRGTCVGVTNGGTIVNQSRRWTGANSQSIYIDDYVLELLTTSTTIFTLPETVANARVSAAWHIDEATIAGVVSNVDNATNPQNYMLAYVRRDDSGNKITLKKCVAGVFSDVIAEATVTYVAGAAIEIRKTASTTYQLWYNGTQMSTDQTVSDATIIDNKIHGSLSTWEGNGLQSFFQLATV